MSYIKGEVTYKVYRDEESSYSVYKIKIDETDCDCFLNHETCSITGYFKNIEIGAEYKFTGKIVNSKKYGFTFVTDIYERILPNSKEGLVAFLSGDSFKGIGPKTAEAIVDALGEDAINKIIENKDCLDNVKGINDLKKIVIYNAIMNNRGIEDTLVTLYSFGITPKLSMRIYDTYKETTLDIIKNNPYRLIDDVDGIAFLKADKIALSTGINLRSEARIEACISYTLYNYSLETGNTYIEKEDLFIEVKRYLSFDTKDDDDLVENCFNNLILRKKVIETGTTLSDYRVYNSEKFIAKKLELMEIYPKTKFFDEEIYKLLKNLEDKLNINYEDDQKEAIYKALTSNVSIITGGPGTGKTTIERGIIYCFSQLIDSNFEVIKLCAPTGKASKRIEESTGYKAQTIHRTLGYDTSGFFGYNRYNLLPAKLVVVDEASMIDIFLFKALLEALPDDSKLVIVGDSDQLPSIGPGQVLKDLIDSNKFTTTKLTKIHRQKKNSKIISLAYDILDEEIKTEIDESHEELAAIPIKQIDIFETLSNTINHFIGKGYSLLSDIEVLIPLYKGGAGIDAINKYLQLTYNNNANISANDSLSTYFIDDKVIQLVNQYEDSVMNGDVGIVKDIVNEKEIIVDFQGNEVKYKGQDIQNISLAYAISIHKSQGSEFPVVILPIFKSYRLIMNKKLLYTAVTRAKDYLVLIGDMNEISHAIKVLSIDRKTRIKDFI